MDNVSNDTLYNVLLEIKEDIGGLKASSALQVEGMKSHHSRIAVLEGAFERQKGALTVWGIVATGVATVVGAAVQMFKH